MKFTPAPHIGRLHKLELSRRNLQALLDKLDDPDSARTLIDPDQRIMVVAVPDEDHYADRAPGVTKTNGVLDESWPGRKTAT